MYSLSLALYTFPFVCLCTHYHLSGEVGELRAQNMLLKRDKTEIEAEFKRFHQSHEMSKESVEASEMSLRRAKAVAEVSEL